MTFRTVIYELLEFMLQENMVVLWFKSVSRNWKWTSWMYFNIVSCRQIKL